MAVAVRKEQRLKAKAVIMFCPIQWMEAVLPTLSIVFLLRCRRILKIPCSAHMTKEYLESPTTDI